MEEQAARSSVASSTAAPRHRARKSRLEFIAHLRSERAASDVPIVQTPSAVARAAASVFELAWWSTNLAREGKNLEAAEESAWVASSRCSLPPDFFWKV